jgi:tetratricopeptide (TPR) repeat protein
MLLAILLYAHAAFACMPEGPGFTPDRGTGASKGYREPAEVRLLRSSKADRPADRLAEYDAWYRERGQSASTSEQARLIEEHDAVRDVLNGNYDAAIRKLLALEGIHPGRQATAGALGTAYERAGDYESALRWINTAIDRDPQTRAGTEWLHARILQARMDLNTDPDRLTRSPIVPLSEAGLPLDGNAYLPCARALSADDLMDALYYQLAEQMLFIKPEDPVVADLLHSFARLEETVSHPEAASAFRALAREYRLNSEDTAEAIATHPSDKFDTRPLAWGAVLVIIAVGLFLKLRTL